MADPQDPAAQLVAHLAWIDRVAASLTRRHGGTADDAEEFASWAKTRLVDDDYAILRKFRGESALTTYLTTVLAMLYRDFRVARFGRWRPSAAAQRRGPVAVRMETLVYRDGMGVEQAARLLHARGETALSVGELARMLAELPPRGPTRPVEVATDVVPDLPSPHGAADAEVLRGEAERHRGALGGALSSSLERLPPEDRVILRLHYWEGLSVADVARALGLEQKPLYRRLERLHRRLRGDLEGAGVSREGVRMLLDEEPV
jgi:RNA polymerase sigma factor for flagellar operon FliA